MTEKETVLINRTRVSKKDWNDLKDKAKVLTKLGRTTTREELIAWGVNKLNKYVDSLIENARKEK